MRSDGLRAGVRRLLRLPLRTEAHAAADANDELRAFLDERVDDLIREILGDVKQDLRYAVRTLRRDAGFAAFAVIIIALGIGASVTVFSVADALLVRPLPFRDPARLVWIPNGGDAGLSEQTTQVGHFLDLAKQNQSFSDVAAYFAFYGVGDTKLSGQNDAIRLSAVPVSQNFFPLLGVQPVIGRGFTEAEAAWNGPKAVLLSHALWVRQFASDASIVGRPIMLNDESVTAVGVLPASFDFGSVFAPGARIDLFVPFPLTRETNQWGNTLSIVARLEPNVTVAGAAAELAVLAPRIAAASPRRNTFTPKVTSLRDHVSGRLRSALGALAFAVGVVMLIVCANLSNLLLARATTRQKEMAIRAALGAGRRRLVRQMLTESVVLSSCGAVLGMALAIVGTRAIAHMTAVSLPLLDNVRIDASAVAFTVVLAVVAGLAFGLVPALQIPEAGVHDALKVSGRSAAGGRRSHSMRRTLVVSEIALACMLLVSSGLLIRSFLKVLDVDLGFRPESVASVRVDPDRQRLTSRQAFAAYLDDVLRLARGVPGIASAAISDRLPLGGNRSWGVRVNGQSYPKGQNPSAFVWIVSEGYVEAMGIQLRAGREFSAQDAWASDRVIVVNETMARTLWPGENPIDKLVVADVERRVIGVVGDVRHLALEEGAGLEMYLPIRQTGDFSSVNLVVRTTLPPAAVGTSLRNALASVSPNLPTNEVRTLGQAVERAVSPRRFFALLLGAFAVFALTLALLGIYGVISYTVNQRTQEIGVRIAVGASGRQIQRRIVRETLELAAIGMLVGTLGSWMAARALGGLLFGVTPSDPITFAGMLVVIAVVAAASGYLPARRASRIDPIVALRSGG